MLFILLFLLLLLLFLLLLLLLLLFIYLFFGRYLLKFGDHSLTRKEESEQTVFPEHIYVHPNFNGSSYMNDIALVKLRKDVTLGKFVRTVCIPRKDEGDFAVTSKYGIVTGWGATMALKSGERPKKAKRYGKILQYSAFTVQQNQLCANSSSMPYNSTVTFCAGDGKGGNDTCLGDGGEAFVRQTKRGDGYRWIAAGLVSWGEGCAQRNRYTYYTRVYPFIDWIKKTMNEG